MSELEQRRNIKFLVKLGNNASEIRDLLVQAYGDKAMKKTTVYKWFKRFSQGRERVTDEERLGRPISSRTFENITKIRRIVSRNRGLTVRNIAEQVKIDRETVRKILAENLGITKVSLINPDDVKEETVEIEVEPVIKDILKEDDKED